MAVRPADWPIDGLGLPGDRAERSGRIALLTLLPRIQRERFAPGSRRPMQVPRETSRQSHRRSGPHPISRPRPLISARGITSATSTPGDADTGGFDGQRLRPMSFLRPDGFPWALEARAARAPATAARATPARTAQAAGGASGRGLSDGSIQRRGPGLFHVEPGGTDRSAPRTSAAESRSGAGVSASRGGPRTGRPGHPSDRARPWAARAHHACRLRP